LATLLITVGPTVGHLSDFRGY